MRNKNLLILPFFAAALMFIGCGAPDVEVEYVSEYESDGEYERELDIDGPAGDYAEAYGLSETEMLELIELKLAEGPGGADFETSDDFDIDDEGTEMEHEVDAESSKGELEYEMDIDSDGEVEYELEAELESGTMQQVLTEARRRRLANANPTVTIVNVANPTDFARDEALVRQDKDVSGSMVVVNLDPDLMTLCKIEAKKPFFEFDKSRLTPTAQDKLSSLATCLISGPARGENIELIGMADPRGSDTYNLNLGMARAESVLTYLNDNGVARSRMTAATAGESAAHDAQPGMWPYDRRVEIRIAR